jgi:RNA polymerase sigma factor (sigma-70 family)
LEKNPKYFFCGGLFQNFTRYGAERIKKLFLEEQKMNFSPKNTILPRIANGDDNAVAECMKQYGNLIWMLAKKYTQSIEDAEDAVQEIFLEIWQNAARFDSAKASEITFISLIARRRLIDRLRKTYRYPNLQSIDEIIESQPNIFEKEIHTKIEAKKALTAMSQVRPEQRNLMMLTIFEGMSHGEIAEQTNLPLGTVKTHIRRGFENVRKIMNRSSIQTAVA